MTDLLTGVERELCSSAPTEARVTLHSFRKRLNQCRVIRKRKAFDRDLEAFLQSKPCLRGAAKRHIRKIAPPAIEAAIAALNAAIGILQKNQAKARS